MEGLALLTKLEEAAWGCMEEQFLTNEAWCATHLLTLTLANDPNPDPDH